MISECVCSLSSHNTGNILVVILHFFVGEENVLLFEKLKGEQGVSVLMEMNEEQYHICLPCKHQLVRWMFLKFIFSCPVIPILVLVILTPHINCINLLYCKCIGVCEDESGGQDQLV